MKGESNPLFVTSRVKAKKFMSRLQILLLEIIKLKRSSPVMGFYVFDGVYWKDMQVDNQVCFTCKRRKRARRKESKREKCSRRELTEWEWHKGTSGRSK